MEHQKHLKKKKKTNTSITKRTTTTKTTTHRIKTMAKHESIGRPEIFLGYFDCVFAMLSSNVGKSEKPGLLLLLAQIFNGSLTTRCWITARVFSSILHHQLSNTCHKTPRTGTLISIGIGFSSILYRYVFFGCIDGVKHLHREIHLK